MKAIVAVDENWAIGYENELLYHISEDLQRFKALTSGNVVIMGRKTLESLPKGKPLPNRINIVLSRNTIDEDVVHCENLASLAKEIEKYSEKEIFVMGGAYTYEQLLPYCDQVYVTKIFDQAENADVFFENLDQAAQWQIIEKSQDYYDGELRYQFITYQNNKVENLNG